MKEQGNASKHEIAANALTHIVECTNYTIFPYLHHPDLINVIKGVVSSNSPPLLIESIMRLIGSIGALDPHKMKQINEYAKMSEMRVSEIYEGAYYLYENMVAESIDFGHDYSQGNNKSEREKAKAEKTILEEALAATKPESIIQLNEIFYPNIAIKALMRILLIPALKDHHGLVIQSARFIVKNLQQECVQYLPIIIPPILCLIQSNESPTLIYDFFMELIKSVGDRIDEYRGSIFKMIYKSMEKDETELTKVFELLENISIYAKLTLKKELNTLIPKLLYFLSIANKLNKKQVKTLLCTFIYLGDCLNDYLELVIPSISNFACIKWENIPEDTIIEYRKLVMQILKSASKCGLFKDYYSYIVPIIIKYMETVDKQVDLSAYSLIEHFMQTFSYALNTAKLKSPSFTESLEKIRKLNYVDTLFMDSTLSTEAVATGKAIGHSASPPPTENYKRPLIRTRESKVDFGILLTEFDASRCFTKEDWIEWLKRTSVELLKQSPSIVLYACSSIAQVYEPLANELYNMAFSSCWDIMNDRQKEYILSNLYHAIESPKAPAVIHQCIFHLAEFMDHAKNALPMLTFTLGQLAERTNALAKALYYREIEFESNPKNVLNNLMFINIGLQQPEAAEGIARYAKKYLNISVKEDWHKSLHHWEEALSAYKSISPEKQKEDEAILGQMQCLKELSDWRSIRQMAESLFGAKKISKNKRSSNESYIFLIGSKKLAPKSNSSQSL